MILVWGDRSDSPIGLVLDELSRRGTPVLHIDQNLNALEYDFVFEPEPSGFIRWRGSKTAVEDIQSIYLRPSDPAPEDRNAAAALSALSSFIAVPVVNRPVAGRSNWSKPYQLQLLKQYGFQVPETLLTTDPAAAGDFIDRHGRVIYKSISGIRSIVNLFDRDNRKRLEDVVSGPVQFQRFIPGCDVRVHVVHDRVFATKVESNAIDYRYPTDHDEISMTPVEIPDSLAQRLIEFVAQQGLLLAGADLRLTPENEWYAFEVNPSPGFSYYEGVTGQPIAAAVVDLLCRS